ncbi:MAG: proline--tRNA ligase [Anaerolineae bacterium]|nr:proline--tRNA ligase [Anaerolineae bacterium]
MVWTDIDEAPALATYSLLPLGQRVAKKIEAILRSEIEKIGGQEFSLPALHPAELWKESGRWDAIDATMFRLKDRHGADACLGMTHEEVFTTLAKELRSYRQLPQTWFQFQTKFRDEARPRAGLIRAREFLMKDAYSLDLNEEGLLAQYAAAYNAYLNIFKRLGLPVIAVNSDTGMMGGKKAHEFMYLAEVGEDTLFVCANCGYAANREAAVFAKEPFAGEGGKGGQGEEEIPSIEKIATPHTATIEDLAAFLNIDKRQTAKAVFFMADFADAPSKLVFCVVRGDHEVNAVAVQNVVKAKALRPATADEIAATGAVAGYASPIGMGRSKALVIVDGLVTQEAGLAAGANEAGFHLLHTRYGRDYEADLCADIAAAYDGAPCDFCGEPLKQVRGVEVGNIFQLGTRYAEALGARYTDERGQPQPIVMGSYGIGVTRVLACLAEKHHDDKGLCWPMAIAPYQVMLISMVKSDESRAIANQVYADLLAAGVEVLLDDRDVSPGVKFGDADLIGLPIRLTVSERSLKNGGIEFKLRRSDVSEIVPVADAIRTVRAVMASAKSLNS